MKGILGPPEKKNVIYFLEKIIENLKKADEVSEAYFNIQNDVGSVYNDIDSALSGGAELTGWVSVDLSVRFLRGK